MSWLQWIMIIAVIAIGAVLGLNFSPNLSTTDDAARVTSTFGTMQNIQSECMQWIYDNEDDGSTVASTFPQTQSVYFPNIPVDSISPNNATAFSTAEYTDSYGHHQCVVFDAVAHNTQALQKYLKYTANGVKPTAYCALTCTKLVYDKVYGQMAQ